jgi:hypothetical protein
MPKQFLTDSDIEDLHRKGIRFLQVGDAVVLTDLAYEKAKRLGVQLVSGTTDAPPAAPVRPYLSDAKPPQTPGRSASVSTAASAPASDIEQRIRSAVLAKLGAQVDAQLLDNIIHRVVKATGLK